MNSAAEVLDYAHKLGVSVWFEGQDLIYDTGRAISLPLEQQNRLKAALTEHKEGIRKLRGGNGHMAVANITEYLPKSATTSPDTFRLPESVWVGWLRDFRDWVSPTTDAPFESIYAAGLTCLGMAAGRNVCIHYGMKRFPNFFILLLGQSGFMRKSTVISRTRLLLEMEHDDTPDTGVGMTVSRGIGSPEGFLELFTSPGDDGGLQPAAGRRVLLNDSEFVSLLKKTQSRIATHLLELLLRLYDGEDIDHRTRVRPIKVVQPFFSILSATTPENLEDRLTNLEIEAGFLPRFMVFHATLRDPIPFPNTPDLGVAGTLVQGLGEITRYAGQVGDHGLSLDVPARNLWDQAYREMSADARGAPGGLGVILERLPEHVLKVALCYSLLRLGTDISIQDLDRALALGRYLRETAKLVPLAVQKSLMAKDEERLLSFFAKVAHQEWVMDSQAHQCFPRIPALKFKPTLAGLTALGRLEEKIERRRGRPVSFHRLRR